MVHNGLERGYNYNLKGTGALLSLDYTTKNDFITLEFQLMNDIDFGNINITPLVGNAAEVITRNRRLMCNFSARIDIDYHTKFVYQQIKRVLKILAGYCTYTFKYLEEFITAILDDLEKPIPFINIMYRHTVTDDDKRK